MTTHKISHRHTVVVVVVVVVEGDNNDDDTVDAICYRPMYVVFVVVAVVRFDIKRTYFLKYIIYIYIMYKVV